MSLWWCWKELHNDISSAGLKATFQIGCSWMGNTSFLLIWKLPGLSSYHLCLQIFSNALRFLSYGQSCLSVLEKKIELYLWYPPPIFSYPFFLDHLLFRHYTSCIICLPSFIAFLLLCYLGDFYNFILNVLLF